MTNSYQPITETPADPCTVTEWWWGDRCSFLGQKCSHSGGATVRGQCPAVYHCPLLLQWKGFQKSAECMKFAIKVTFSTFLLSISSWSQFLVPGTCTEGTVFSWEVSLEGRASFEGRAVPLSAFCFVPAGIGLDGWSWSCHLGSWRLECIVRINEE